MDSTDLSPSTVEFLEKEKIFLDEHKDDDVNCTRNKVCTSKVSGMQDQMMNSPASSSDDEIGSLLMKMKELLSPRDLEYLRSNEGKDVEDLLKETEEFIQNSSSLFHNLSFNSSSTESSAGVIAYPEKSNEPNEHVDVLMKEMEKVAEETSVLVNHVMLPNAEVDERKVYEVASVSSNDNEDNVSPAVSVAEKLEINDGEIDDTKLLRSDHGSISKDCVLQDTDEASSDSNDNNVERIDSDKNIELVKMNGDSDSDSSKENYPINNDCVNENKNVINLSSENDRNHNFVDLTNENNCKNKIHNVNVFPPLTQLNSEECELITDLNAKGLTSPKDNMSNHDNGNNDINCNTVTNEDYLQKLKVALQEANTKHKTEIELLQKKYEDEILRLKEHINTLNAKLIKYESDASWKETGGGDNRRISRVSLEDKKIKELEAEIKKQDHLIAGYQRENQKLFADITASKELWKKEKSELEEKIRAGSKLDNKNLILQDQLKDAQEAIVRYQLELQNYKEQWKQEKMQLEDKIRSASSLDNKNLVLQTQLKDAQETNVKFQLELENYKMEKMSDELMKWQADNDQLIDPSDLNLEVDSLKITITQLQAALNVERTQKKNLSRDKDLLLRENMDLKRQVREVEGIIKRRSHSDSTLSKVIGEGRLKELEKELQARQSALNSMQTQLEDMQVKYNDHIIELEQRLKLNQEENNVLKQKLDDVQQRGVEASTASQSSKRTLASTNSATQPTNIYSQNSRAASSSNKEDAHLLATIRGMKIELAKKDKDLLKLNKELEDARKTNRRLQREREKQLKTVNLQKSTSLQSSNLIKIDNKGTSISDSAAVTHERRYNQAMFEEEHEEETALLKMENKSLREEIQRLGQDIVTLHSKRIQDLRTLQSEHEQEIQRLLNDYSNRHSQSKVAELQGQIYTHQMVITHLKDQLKQLTELKEENAMLKLERDHLEKVLMGANKKIQELQTPESQQYQSLLEKFENLEQRHEVREQKLQAIVRDLLAQSSEPVPCGPVCRNKLLDKNREICYYRLEMDRILEALREFKRSK